MKTSHAQIFAFASIALLAAFSRLIPHPENFTPVVGIAMVSGLWFAPGAQSRRSWGWLVPVLAMFLSDLVIGFHALSFLIYGLIALTYGIAMRARLESSARKIAGLTVLSSVIFFAVSNLGVWLMGDLYPLTREGFQACYLAAVPFFRNSLAGDLFYTAVLVAVARRMSSANRGLILDKVSSH